MDRQSKLTNTEVYCLQYILNEANPLHFGAQEYVCAMQALDNMAIPRFEGKERLSLVGRIARLNEDQNPNEIMRQLYWHYDKPIPKPYEVLAILKSKSGGLVFDKVNSLFPIDENWEVVCWAHVPIDAIANGRDGAPQSASENESACT